MNVQAISQAPPQTKTKPLVQKSDIDDLTSTISQMAVSPAKTTNTTPVSPPYYQEFRGDYDHRWRQDSKGYLLHPPQNAHTHALSEVGDSDEDPSDKESIGKARVKTLIKATHTTLYSQKKRIKGDEIIALCQKWAQSAITKAITDNGAIAKTKGHYRIHSTDDWLRSAGHLVANPSKDMITNTPFFDTLCVGRRKVLLTLKKQGTTERLYFPAALLQTITKATTLPTHTDLSCKEIADITETRITELKTTDKQYAEWQLARLKGEAGPDKTVDRQWLDCVNTWLFGVEASRNNATFVTGVMTLELIAAGELTYKHAFAENQYGGRFPMATLQSGTGNMAARRKLIEHAENGKAAGMKTDRMNPQWLAISLKEAVLIKKWLIHFKHADSQMSKKTILAKYEAAVSGVLKNYFGTELS